MISDTQIHRKGISPDGEAATSEVAFEDRQAAANFLDVFLPLAEHKAFIAKTTIIAAIAALIISFLIPNRYTAVTKILPPQQTQSSLSSMLGQLSALSGLAGGKDNLLGLKNPSDLYVGILKSRTIADALIDQFDLKHLYRDKKMADARKDLDKHTFIEVGKDGMISVAFEDKDAKRAAAIANAYVERLYQANQRLAISEASQRRLFYEKELEVQKEALAMAEVELKKVQEKTGLIQLGSQADVIIRASAMLKAQITSKEVQLRGMRSFSTEENPALMRTEQELEALKSQMTKLENDQKLGGGNIQIPTSKVPEIGLEYVRRSRDVRYHEVLFEILAKQYEAAKIDEGKNAPVIHVVDRAIEPDKKSYPPRAWIVSLAALLAAVLACFYLRWSAQFATFKSNPEQRMKLQMLMDALGRKKDLARSSYH